MHSHPAPVAIGLLVVAAAAIGIAVNQWRAPLTYRIPPGTVAWAEAGEPENILPDSVYVDLRRRDTVIIANDDDQPFSFGSASVAPGTSLVQRFEIPGVYLVMCSLRGDQIRFVVLGPDGTTTNSGPP